MSSDISQNAAINSLPEGDQTHLRSGDASYSQNREMHSHIGDCIRSHGNEGAQAAPSRNEISCPTTPGLLEKEKKDRDEDSPAIEESMEARLERLGRQRPETFKSAWSETGFVFSVCMCQVLSEYFVSGFTVILPTVVKDLHIPIASETWPASAFSLTNGSFLLIFGRLADMYGGFPVYIAGLAWLVIWSLVAGFSTNALMLNFCRALQGLGPAAFLPSSVMILGTIYRPGPRKNVVFSLYGACTVLGFFAGIFFAGVTAQYTKWSWYFWIGAILSAITALTAYLSVTNDSQEKRNQPIKVKMDWLGAVTSVCGLILFTFALIDSSHAPNQWKTPYIYIIFIISCLILLLFIYIEGWVATEPLLPGSLFRVPYMIPLVIGLFFTMGALGIYILYATLYMQSVMAATPLQVVAWYVPMAFGGMIIATFGGFVLHLLPGTLLVIISGTSFIIAPLLFAIAPAGANYWAYVFPSMICSTVGIDITFNVANIFITTSLPRAQQGLAGALIMLLVNLGIAIWLGFADIVNTYTVARLGARKSYHAVFWLEVACAGAALVVFVLFVRLDNARSEMTVDEREEMERESGPAEEGDRKEEEEPRLGMAGA